MFHKVCSRNEVADGAIVSAEVAGTELIVFESEGKVCATERYCVHQGADLTDGIVSRGFLICPSHMWKFHADSGVHKMSKMTCLVTYATKVEGDEIWVDPTPIRNAEVPQ